MQPTPAGSSPNRPRSNRARKRALVGAVLAAGGVVASLGATGLLPALPATAEPNPTVPTPLRAPIYNVVQEGLNANEVARIAELAGVRPRLGADGSLDYVDAERYGRVPSIEVGRGADEDGRPTTDFAIDFDALDRTTELPETEALARGAKLLPPPRGMTAVPLVGHTTFDQADGDGNPIRSKHLDTSVSYQLAIGDTPVVGPGAKLRVAFAGDGSVLRLNAAVRSVEPAGQVPIISPGMAIRYCGQLYGPKLAQSAPQLVYYSPPLGADTRLVGNDAATEGNGRAIAGAGRVRLLVPHYLCQPKGVPDDGDSLGGKLIPAAPSLAPTVQIVASGDGVSIDAKAFVSGGSGPYRFRWSAAGAALDTNTQAQDFHFRVGGRSEGEPQHVTLQVTDANGVATTAAVELPAGKGEAKAIGNPGGMGGVFAEAGIENMVEEWQCAQDSANGFHQVMAAHSQTVTFDFRGSSAWEKDFKDQSLGGIDNQFVDAVDIQWYTGHGSPKKFTFDTNKDDTDLTPADARWGDGDLEWLQLESCQVLADTNGKNDYFARWGSAFRGLHLLNGFHTNASCIDGGTGATFANLLFPLSIGGNAVLPALTVQQAWGATAEALEPAGRVWRSISPATTGWVTNLNDHYWGQGSVGPDITPGGGAHPLLGWVSVSGMA